MKKLVYWFLPLFTVLCVGCNGIGVKGSGILKDETRDIQNFTEAEISGAYEVYIKCGEKPSLEMTGDDNIISLIHTDVSDGKLSIWTDRNISIRRKIKIKITTKTLEALELSGASRVKLTKVDCDRLHLDISGAVTLITSGKTDMLDLNISGASNADTKRLLANDVHVDLSGASHANVYAKDLLKAQVSGVSNIKYFGDPKVVRKISGLGSISQEGD